MKLKRITVPRLSISDNFGNHTMSEAEILFDPEVNDITRDNFDQTIHDYFLTENAITIPTRFNGGDFKVRIVQMIGFNDQQKELFIEGCRVFSAVLNSDEFKTELLKLSMTQRRGYSNDQIYERLMAGIIGNGYNIRVTLYRDDKSRVIGYQQGQFTWVNSKYFDIYTPAEVAHNIAHEYCHIHGFSHTGLWITSTVAYKVGYLVGKLGKQHETTAIFDIKDK